MYEDECMVEGVKEVKDPFLVWGEGTARQPKYM